MMVQQSPILFWFWISHQAWCSLPSPGEEIKWQPASVCLFFCPSGSKITHKLMKRFFFFFLHFLKLCKLGFYRPFCSEQSLNDLPKIIGLVSIKMQEKVILNLKFQILIHLLSSYQPLWLLVSPFKDRQQTGFKPAGCWIFLKTSGSDWLMDQC